MEIDMKDEGAQVGTLQEDLFRSHSHSVIIYRRDDYRLLAHKIAVLIDFIGVDSFFRKYMISVHLRINYAWAKNQIEQHLYFNVDENDESSMRDEKNLYLCHALKPTGAPGRMGISPEEIRFMKDFCHHGYYLGRIFFDDESDWVEVKTDEAIDLFKLNFPNELNGGTSTIMRHINEDCPFYFHLVLKELKNEYKK